MMITANLARLEQNLKIEAIRDFAIEYINT